MDSYRNDWEKYYQSELLTLWGLLGPNIRSYLTPEQFRDWLFQHSYHLHWYNGEAEMLDHSNEFEYDPEEYPEEFIDLLGSRYQEMISFCHQNHLPLLTYYQRALPSLLQICGETEA